MYRHVSRIKTLRNLLWMLAVAHTGNLHPLLALHHHGYLLQVINYEDLFIFRHMAPPFLLSCNTGTGTLLI
jgi:hypothetical protein